MSKANQDDDQEKPLQLEITVISAQGLRSTKDSFLFFPTRRRLRPFVTLTTNPPTIPYVPFSGRYVYQTKVDTTGGESPSWGDKFHIPIGNSFFSQRHSCIYLHIFSRPSRSWGRKCELGWCGIPATDLLEGFRPAGAVRQLSYRVRERDGTRGNGVVNVAVNLVGSSGQTLSGQPDPSPAAMSNLTGLGLGLGLGPGPCQGRTAIGIPVEALFRLNMDKSGRQAATGVIAPIPSAPTPQAQREPVHEKEKKW
ncbi:BON1-associated protein 2-like [Macadamia integrifolia]|uniref:BON1-associated protein 2-like n=1 Tax=Macadamia integrifolia TaxID=60698 RepID=UPI001C501DB8|nr:BON1-associated protein 2-like [Macadamia integrifolia]